MVAGRRVVVTGAAGLSPIGNDWEMVSANLQRCENGVVCMDDWGAVEGLHTRLAAPTAFETPASWPRKMRRSLGRVSAMAVRASELALDEAGLAQDPVLRSGQSGVAFGSSAGAMESLREVGDFMNAPTMANLSANTYIKMMPHTTAAAVGMFFGLTGRILPSSTACTSGSLAIGMAAEAIRYGHQEVMIAGGAEELDVLSAAVFDRLYATSTRNEEPKCTPRPFDADRDGLVVGEGAATFVLESRDRALARGARVLAEVVGVRHQLRWQPPHTTHTADDGGGHAPGAA